MAGQAWKYSGELDERDLTQRDQRRCADYPAAQPWQWSRPLLCNAWRLGIPIYGWISSLFFHGFKNAQHTNESKKRNESEYKQQHCDLLFCYI